ncbi:MAG: hypothetical protein AAGI50_19310 [Pseudomonadota bacterium]
MPARVFLPARRGQSVVVFEHREIPEKRRWEFFAVAAACGPDAPLKRTGNITLSSEALEECQRVAAALPALEAQLSRVTLTSLDVAELMLDLPSEALVADGSPVLTVTLYLQLQRQLAVLAATRARYTARPAAERLDRTLSASLYAGLLRVHDVASAAALLDADLPHLHSQPIRHGDWIYFFSQAATVREREGRREEAVALLLRGIEIDPRHGEAWRRIANLRNDAGDRAGAIDAFLAAEDICALPREATQKLSRWLTKAGRLDEAQRFERLAVDR